MLPIRHRGKLGNGEHLSIEAYKYEENHMYVLTIMQHKDEVKFYPETQIYLFNTKRYLLDFQPYRPKCVKIVYSD